MVLGQKKMEKRKDRKKKLRKNIQILKPNNYEKKKLQKKRAIKLRNK